MNRILSQAEVETLLKGVQDGTEGGSSVQVRKYDFREGSFLMNRLTAFSGVSERFARIFKDSLSLLILRAVDVEAVEVEVTNFGEIVKMTPVPSNINIIKIRPFDVDALLIIEAQLVFVILELYFGSPKAQITEIKERPFTPVEQRIIRKLVKLLLQDLVAAFKDIVTVNLDVLSTESNIQFVDMFSQKETVVKLEFHIKVNGFTGRIFFCIAPVFVEHLKPRERKKAKSLAADRIDRKWYNAVINAVLNSEVEVVAELASVDLTFEELLSLDVGHVLTTNKKVDSEMSVKVHGVRKFAGIAGSSRGYKSVKITKVY